MTALEAIHSVMSDAAQRVREDTTTSSEVIIACAQQLRLIEWRELRQLEETIVHLRRVLSELQEVLPAFGATYPVIARAKRVVSGTLDLLVSQAGLEVPA